MRPGSYDLGRDMYFQRIAASGFVLAASSEPPESRGPSLRYAAFMQGLRERSMRALDCLDGDKRAMATALLIGRRDAVGIAAQGRSDAAMLNAVTVFGLTLGR